MENYSYRRYKIGVQLAEDGVVSLLYCMPYYGKRRKDKKAMGHIFDDVTQVLLKGVTCIEETKALAFYLHSHNISNLCISGISMGALNANIVISNLPFPVANVSFLPSESLGGFWNGPM